MLGRLYIGTSATFAGAAGKTYQFRARAVDKAGNYGSYSDSKQTVVPRNESSGVFSGLWSVVSQSKALAGKVKSTTRKNSSVTFTATGTLYSLLVTKGTGRSKAKVYVDGVYVKTIDTLAASTKYRQLILLKSFATADSHQIKIVNLPTAGRKNLQIDGLAVVR